MDTFVGFTNLSNRTAFAYDENASFILAGDFWRVCVPFRYYVGTKDSDEWVDVELGFLTNGADIPRIVWSLLPRHGEYDQAVALHDKLCEKPEIMTPTGPKVISRARVDSIFYEALQVLKVAKWKLTFIRGGVDLYRTFTGGRFTKPSAAKVHLQTDPVVLKNFFDGFVLKTVL